MKKKIVKIEPLVPSTPTRETEGVRLLNRENLVDTFYTTVIKGYNPCLLRHYKYLTLVT